MQTFWVLTYIVVAWSHTADGIDKRYEPRVQVMSSQKVCEATAKELTRITSEFILIRAGCQQLELRILPEDSS